MKKSAFAACIFISTLLLAACEDRNYYHLTGYAQGGTYSVTYQGGKKSPIEFKNGVDSLLQEFDKCLSGYNPDSDLSHFNRGDSIVLSPLFADIYVLSYYMWAESKGAFDIACGPLFDIWGFGFSQDNMPEESEIQDCLKNCGMKRLKDPFQIKLMEGKKVCSKDFLADENAALPKLNFNAIAQGYSCDLIARYLESYGVKNLLVDLGEIFCSGKNPQGKGWSIGIDNPVDGNNKPGADIREIWNSEKRSVGVVTSGNYRKYYIKDGKKYAHTIDPRTGRPVEHDLLSATVIAPYAWKADALATIFMVIGFEQSVEYLDRHPEIEACLISRDGVWKSWSRD